MNLERSWKMKRAGLGDEARRTAYCGLHCGDCIPSRDGLYSALMEARKQLADVDFHAYCRIRSRRDPRLEKYQDFEDTLDAIISTRCMLPCREGGGKTDCRVRDCAREKGLEGCWECSSAELCPKLEPLRQHHPFDENLRLIHELGIEGWTEGRRKHYRHINVK